MMSSRGGIPFGKIVLSSASRTSTANIPLTLKLRKYRNDTGALLGSASGSIPLLRTSWQRVSFAYVPLAPGASTLDYTASVANIPACGVMLL
jgi:hypothetical protein